MESFLKKGRGVMRSLLALFLTSFFIVNLGCSEQPQTNDAPTSIVAADYKKLLSDPNKKLVETWTFPGTEMGPAEMYFWSNGLLTVNSEIFSKKKRENYFLWALNKDRTLMMINYADERISFETIVLPVERSHLQRHVHSIDVNSRTVTYLVKDREAIFFLNWRFGGKPIGN